MIALRVRELGAMLAGMLKLVLLFVLLLALAGGGCASTPAERPNLSLQKQALIHYVESSAYGRDVARVAAEASAWIEQRVSARGPHERLTVVFDLDDTLLSNWPYMLEHDFGWDAATWQAWVDTARAPVIAPVRDVYRRARQLNVEVIYLTARPEHDREATAKNLRAIECGEYVELICQPHDSKGTAAVFKAAERTRLQAEGRVIIAMIGDQASDLAGGGAERMFKLPNPFYFTP